MNFEPIQKSITTQLSNGFTAAAVDYIAQDLPESVADYSRAVTVPRAYVVYTGSTSPGVKNTNPTTQDRKAQFAVECYGRSLYDLEGVHALAALVEKLLVGFCPLSCDRLYLVKDDLIKGDDGIWCRVIQFECMTMVVQDQLSDPVVVPGLQGASIKFQNLGNSGDPDNGTSDPII